MSQPIQPPPQQPPPIQPPQPLRPESPFPPIGKKRKPFGWVALIITAVVALGVGGAVGGSGEATVATPAPTVTATPAPAPTKTVTKEVAEVPASCLTALDNADKGFDIAADMLDVIQATFEVIVDGLRTDNYDVDEINAQADNLNELTDKLTPVGERYNDAKADCRAAAE